jgi:hypothetical protein
VGSEFLRQAVEGFHKVKSDNPKFATIAEGVRACEISHEDLALNIHAVPKPSLKEVHTVPSATAAKVRDPLSKELFEKFPFRRKHHKRPHV